MAIAADTVTVSAFVFRAASAVYANLFLFSLSPSLCSSNSTGYFCAKLNSHTPRAWAQLMNVLYSSSVTSHQLIGGMSEGRGRFARKIETILRPCAGPV